MGGAAVGCRCARGAPPRTPRSPARPDRARPAAGGPAPPCSGPAARRRLLRAPARAARGGAEGAAAAAPPPPPPPAPPAPPPPVERGVCLPAYVTVDQAVNLRFTVLEVEVRDYPGLLRSIAWVLNGLDLVAQNAVFRTDAATRVSRDTFWLTTRAGRKLSDAAAEAAADRVRYVVEYCAPDEAAGPPPTEWAVGPIAVSNAEHADYSVVYVREERFRPGFLLDVTSVMAGAGLEIAQGVVQGCSDCGDEVPRLGSGGGGGPPPPARGGGSARPAARGSAAAAPGAAAPPPGDGSRRLGDSGRTFKFWVRAGGEKLGPAAVAAVVFSLNAALGLAAHPLTPPDAAVARGAR